LSLEQLDPRITEALKDQRRDAPIILTEGPDTVGLLLRLPDDTRDLDVDGTFWLEEPTGRVLVVIQGKHSQTSAGAAEAGQPVFGSCKGMMTMVSDDDEHLKDFEEYMK